MKKASLCLLGIFISASSIAQTAPSSTVPNAQLAKTDAKKSAKDSKDPKVKGVHIKPMTIKPDTSNKIELKTTKEYVNNIKPAEKIPDDIQKRLKAVPPYTGNEKVVPPNITNFTAQDMKNDPTLKPGNKVFYMNEKLTGLTALEEYNIKRSQFLKQKELTRQKVQEQMKLQNEKMQEQAKYIRERDAYRKSLGLPISRFENNKGPNGNESGLTREAMGMMNNGVQKLPPVPPTGNIQSVPGK